jgi:hypothetical protein
MNAERGPAAGGPERLSLIQRLKRLLQNLLMDKKIKELRAAERAQAQRAQQETRERREEEKRQRENQDRARQYHQARSGEIEEVQVQLARAQRSQAVKDKLGQVINDSNQVPTGADYLVRVFGQHADVIKNLIDQNPAVAEAVNTFITKGVELHGSAVELIKEAQKLSYEANKTEIGRGGQLNDVFAAISGRVQELIWDEMQTKRRINRRQGIEGPNTVAELLEKEPGIVMGEEKIALGRAEHVRRRDEQGREREEKEIDWEQTRVSWNQAINTMIRTPRAEVAGRDTDWVRGRGRADQTVAAKAVPAIDTIWSEIERRETTGGESLSVDELTDFDRKIREAESREFPKDVPAGSEAYKRAVASIRQYSDERSRVLSEKLKERLRIQTPSVAEGIVDEEKFMLAMVRHKGRLGDILAQNPEMEKLFLGTGEKSGRFRNRVFLKIHSSVINDQRNASHDNFGLYERADFTSFVDLLRIGLGKVTVPETGESLGQAWTDYYNNLSNAIRQSRDIDFWASQPGASVENFNKSLGMFQNEYTSHAMSIPAVVAAFRAYETTLRSIMASNDGYIPPALIEYSAANKGSFWDQRSREMLKNMIAMGAVRDVERDGYYFHKVGEDGNMVLPGGLLKENPPDDDELSMYMVLAKGFGIASIRYLEMFANSRIPGSDHPERGMENFHSIPYEGIARSLNYMSTYINKWRIGSYKYFYLFNQLVPREKWIHLGDSKEAVQAYMLYQDDPKKFEDKFGTEAKRFIDLTNFSGISSAIGKDTRWRQFDSTILLNDKQREWLGGPTRLALVELGSYVDEALKDFLVVNKYKEQYRQQIIMQNQAQPGRPLSTAGAGFDKLWKEYGEPQFTARISREWDKLRGWDPQKGRPHGGVSHDFEHMRNIFKNAFKARIWVEMTMRNPLVVAHNLKVATPVVSFEGAEGIKPHKVELHNLLVQDILGIPPEDTKYGEMYGRSGYGATPTQRQKDYMIAVMALEGDLAAVRQRAIDECRDLTPADFDIIKDHSTGGRRYQALEYWRRVRMHVLGTADERQGEKLYKAFGLGVAQNGDNYEWDFEKMRQLVKKDGLADEITGENQERLQITANLKDVVAMKPEWILGTDDMAFGKMDMLNLGSRHWLRRGGDINGHWNGGQAMVDYLVHGLIPTPDKQKLAEMLMKLRDAYSEDMIEAGWGVASSLAVMTDKLYSWDWKRMGSTAQLDVWKTRRNVAAWMANGRREFWDALEHLDVLPPHGQFYYYNIPEKTDIHTLRRMCRADTMHVVREIIALGMLLALMITIYRALTAPSEEEEHH